MNKIEVTINATHFRKALSFSANNNPLEVALNEQYPDLKALVGGTIVLTEQGEYKIPTKVWGGKDAKFTPGMIDKYCNEAKKGSVGIPTIKFSIVQ